MINSNEVRYIYFGRCEISSPENFERLEKRLNNELDSNATMELCLLEYRLNNASLPRLFEMLNRWPQLTHLQLCNNSLTHLKGEIPPFPPTIKNLTIHGNSVYDNFLNCLQRAFQAGFITHANLSLSEVYFEHKDLTAQPLVINFLDAMLNSTSLQHLDLYLQLNLNSDMCFNIEEVKACIEKYSQQIENIKYKVFEYSSSANVSIEFSR